MSGRLVSEALDVEQPFVAAVLNAEILNMCIKILKFCFPKILGRGGGAWGNTCVPLGPGQ